ncbi:MAG: PAS domain S-box protein, partial [Planctomycetota bacterium]
WSGRRILHANPAVLELVGATPEELREDPLRWRSLLHPHDRPYVNAFLAGEIPSTTREMEVRMQSPDGDYRWIKVRLVPVGGGSQQLVGLAEDITERKETNDALRRFRFMVERQADAVFWIDRDARIQYANRAAARGLGLELDLLIGLSVSDIDAEMEAAGWPAHWDNLERHRSLVFESRHRRMDGSTFPVEVSANHVTFGGTSFNCAIVRDITERKAVERELEDALAEAQQSKHARDQFIANLSHEIRSPLTAMLGFIDLLAPHVAQDEQSETWLELVKRSGRHLDQMLHSLLNFRELEDRGDGLRLEQTTLPDLLAASVTGFRERATSEGLEFKFESEGEVPEQVLADSTRVRQMLSNLVDNALKYTERGFIQVEVRELEGRGDRSRLQLGVRDSGCGMTPAQTAEAFNRFRRFNADPSVRGVGLGLSIVRQLARGMGGDAFIESTLGSGTFVWCEIEVACSEARSPLRLGELEDQISFRSPQLEPLTGKVLLAEDADDLSALYLYWLESWGLEVTAVPDGREALAEAATGDYDLLLLDWRMPQLDGLQVATHVRRAGFDVPIIGLSAHATADAMVDWLTAGANGYLCKPVPPEALHDELRAHLAASPASDSAAEVEPDFADRVRASFLQGLRSGIEQAQAAERGHRLAELRDLAHRFKGSAGSFGYDRLGDLSRTLEAACSEGGSTCKAAWAAWLDEAERLTR